MTPVDARKPFGNEGMGSTSINAIVGLHRTTIGAKQMEVLHLNFETASLMDVLVLLMHLL